MSKRLRENIDDLHALVALTAEALRMPEAYVEKDFWITEILRVASLPQIIGLPDGSEAPVTFTFKGGTSLSRVYGILERFSEDIDLIAEFPAETSLTARHKILKRVDVAVRGHLSLVDSDVKIESSTTGVKRYTIYMYPTRARNSSIKDGVLLELGSRGGTHPSGVHRYRSLVSHHAITELSEDESVWEEFAGFDVRVLTPERTLFEKLAAVHDAATRNDTNSLLKFGRHFYDIYRLLHDYTVRSALASMDTEMKLNLIHDIEYQSRTAGFSSTPRPTEGYASSPAFKSEHPAREAIEQGYRAARELIYGQQVSFEEVVFTVQRMQKVL